MKASQTVLLLFALLMVQTASGTTRTVTSLNDDGGAGTLRTLISASAANDTINFSVTGTITLTGSELLIGRNLTILGPAAPGIVVSGNNASRVFNIIAGTVNLSGLTIASGWVGGMAGSSGVNGINGGAGGNTNGGGILNQATLNLTNCTISGNSAVGGNGGNGVASNDGLSGGNGGNGGTASGGGIFNQNTLTLINCTVSGNSCNGGNGGSGNGGNGGGGGGPDFGGSGGSGGAASAGGIFNQNTLTLINCTVSGNLCNGGGGGGGGNAADDGGSGGNGGAASGGGSVNSSTMSLLNCAFSGNTSTGGSGGSGGVATTMQFSVGGNGGDGGSVNGGGLNSSGNCSIHNTIFAGDGATGGSGGAGGVGGNSNNPNSPAGSTGTTSGLDVNGTISSQGHNLIGKSDGSSGWLGSDLTGTIATPLNPLLGPLQNNGGPTYTMAPQPGSAAIDAGDDAVLNAPYNLTTDQRGFPRKSGAHVDIGAYEAISTGGMIVVTNTTDNGPGSLRQALFAVGSGGVVTFAPGVSGNITLTTGELLIGKDLTLIGPTAAGVTISGNNATRVFHVTNGIVSLANLTIANGNTSDMGGGLYNEVGTTLILNNCTVSSNVASVQFSSAGGGIYSYGAIFATNCTISGNRAAYGAGLYNAYNGPCVLRSCTISSNAGFWAGGIYNYGGYAQTVIGNTIIAGNSGNAPDAYILVYFTSQGYNLIGINNSGSGITNGVNQDQAGTAGTPLNPLLGPLQNNGGPTFTHALLTGSPAIDKGKSFGLATDQRGLARIFDYAAIANATGGDGSDIGAYESQILSPVLGIARLANNKLGLSWSTNNPGFGLQFATVLRSAPALTTWTNAPGSVAIVGGNYIVTNTVPAANIFYRLQSQ